MNISSYVVPIDTCAKITALQKVLYNNIAAGTSVEGSLNQYIRFNKYCAGQTARFALDIKGDYMKSIINLLILIQYSYSMTLNKHIIF